MLSLDVFMVLKIEFLLNSQENNFLYPWHCASYFPMLLEISIKIFIATRRGQDRPRHCFGKRGALFTVDRRLAILLLEPVGTARDGIVPKPAIIIITFSLLSCLQSFVLWN